MQRMLNRFAGVLWMVGKKLKLAVKEDGPGLEEISPAANSRRVEWQQMIQWFMRLTYVLHTGMRRIKMIQKHEQRKAGGTDVERIH